MVLPAFCNKMYKCEDPFQRSKRLSSHLYILVKLPKFNRARIITPTSISADNLSVSYQRWMVCLYFLIDMKRWDRPYTRILGARHYLFLIRMNVILKFTFLSVWCILYLKIHQRFLVFCGDETVAVSTIRRVIRAKSSQK